MDNLTAFATFLQQYGPFAMSTVFAALYMLERRERRATQDRYESYLVAGPGQMREFAEAHYQAVENLERAFIRAGIDTERPLDKEEEEGDDKPTH